MDKTGGPAFPGVQYISMNGKQNPEGMTLRDYFAAQAMKGMLSNPKLEKQIIQNGQSWIETSAYAWADGMLKVREQ